MPLRPGASLSENIKELMSSYKEKGTIGTSTPKSKKKALRQAIAISERVKNG